MKKVILVTGASAGMGKDFARELARDGHIVYGAARRVDKMEDITRSMAPEKTAGRSALFDQRKRP